MAGSPPYSDEDLIQDIQRVADELGRPPTSEEYGDRGKASPATLDSHFGSFIEAIEAAGFEYSGRGCSDEDLIQDIQRVADKLGRPPTYSEYDDRGEFGTTTLNNHFGSFIEAIEAAGLEHSKQLVSDEELIQDIQRVAEKVDGPPLIREYREHGKYSDDTLIRRFGSFNDAVDAAGLEANYELNPTPENIIEDIQRLVDELGSSPTKSEYIEHGKYPEKYVRNQMGAFSDAIRAAGYMPHKPYEVPPKRILLDLRNVADRLPDSANVAQKYCDPGVGEYSIGLINEEFGIWRGLVRAGIHPSRNLPLSPIAYKMFVHTAIECDPREALYGQLMAFSGIPVKILERFNLNWVSRLNSDSRETLVTVPSRYLATDKDWVITVPERWTDPITGTTKQTSVNELLKLFQSVGASDFYNSEVSLQEVINQITKKSEIEYNIERRELRASIAVHLARRKIPTWKIQHQVGAEKTNWERSVEDYYLYLYQFEGYCHPSYEPSGVYLNPDTGEPRYENS
jgi:hypothetical protein